MELAKVLILKGDGINCERELGAAFIEAGAEVKYLHLNDLLKNPKSLHEFDILGMPGGFSFGDELRSGKVMALKMSHHLGDELKTFSQNKKLIIGICNGFQALVQLNAFHFFDREKKYTLSENNHGKFLNFWSEVKITNNVSPWLKSLEGSIYLPVRNKEGRFLGEIHSSQKCLNYVEDINGSLENIAGITNLDGTILGMMPHPEAALHPHLYPFGDVNDPRVLNNIFKIKKIFTNAVTYRVEKKA